MLATIVGDVPRTRARTISVSCDLFLKKGGMISCVVTGPRPQYSRDLEKLLRDQQRIYQFAPFPRKVLVRTSPSYSIVSHH